MRLVAPSILAANFNKLGDDIEMLNKSEADFIHCDIMDGVFVPNISFGIPIVQNINEISTKPLDVHLMIVNPEKYIDGFRNAGADVINIHYEACKEKELKSILKTIKDSGARPAITIKPDTAVSRIFDFAEFIDMVLSLNTAR